MKSPHFDQSAQMSGPRAPSPVPRQPPASWRALLTLWILAFLSIILIVFAAMHPGRTGEIITNLVEFAVSILPLTILLTLFALFGKPIVAVIERAGEALDVWLHALGQIQRNKVLSHSDNHIVVKDGRQPIQVTAVREITEHRHYDGQIALPEVASSLHGAITLTQLLPLIEKIAERNQQLPVEEKQWVHGIEQGKPKIGLLTDLRSFVTGGMQGSGKTSTMTWCAGQSVAYGGKLLIFDPDENSKEGIVDRLMPLREAFICDPLDCENQRETVDRFKWVQEQLDSRRALGNDDAPLLFIVIDEWNQLLRSLRDTKLRATVLDVLRNVLQGGRKYHIFVEAAMQTVQGSSMGGADVRQSFPARIAHRMERSQIALLLDCEVEELKPFLSPPLATGEVLVSTTNGQRYRMAMPYTTKEDCQAVATLVNRFTKHPSGLLVPNLSLERSSPLSRENNKPEESTDLPQGDAGKVGETGGKSGKVSRKDMLCERIRAAGRQQVEEQGYVLATKIVTDLRLSHKDYDLVQEVREQEKWPGKPTGMTEAEWLALKQYYGYTCLACGEKETSENPLERDHIMPREDGGSDDVSNRQPLHKLCNASKGRQYIDYRPAWEARKNKKEA